MTVTTAAGPGPAPDEAPDTGWFVYGVTRADLPVPDDLVGVDEEPVRLVAHGQLAAAVGRVLLDRPPGRRRELIAYSQVLDRLAALGPVVPVRFGAILVDDQDVTESLLAPDEQRFADLLDQLAGRVQLNLRATYLEDVVLAEVVAAEPEIARLRERTRDQPPDALLNERLRLGELVAGAVEARRVVDADTLVADLEPLVVAYAGRPAGGLDHVLDVALLVDQDRQAELEQLLEDWAEAAHDRIRMRLVGPVAPYDFVGGG